MDSLPSSTNGTSSSWESVLTNAQSHKASIVLLTPTIGIVLWFFASWQISSLKRYPGPFLAGWTNLWRLWQVISADYAPRMKKLHEKYGPVVRLGPNLLDIDIPELVKVIYSTDGKWTKSNFYQNSSSIINGKITYHMFSEVDNVEHARLKRPVVRHYSVPSVLAMEPHMDQVIDEFCDHLQSRFVDTGKKCDFGDWLAYYAWDFLGYVTFSKKFGYMDAGRDFDGTLAIGDQSIDYLGLCGQMPWMDYWLDKNPVYPLGPPNISNVTRIAVENMTERLKGEDTNFTPEKPDFLQYFIDSKGTHPEIVNEGTIIGYLLLNLIAGADTTAITMRALFYYCLKNPRIWKRLEAEVIANIPSDKPASHSAARALPYLEAVCRETTRYHPAVSMTMERIVPEGGLALPDGSVVPGGSLVGMNPYIVGRNKSVYGEDADEFRPERWLRQEAEGEDAYKLRMRQWNAADITFGGGSRICLGRNLSQMEVYKVVPSLISRFEIELVDPNEKWWTSSRWFYRTKGVVCHLKRRTAKA
ncbi:benzoate 4-monooxygenase cytochrome p450 [Colletotrichum scovillei]|uniref:Benzoate 4-monooxygenase cytochrome p450 n=1 Tax=Colletotrichum scovillei TaxID=1209932 RepID=A0A9P7U5L7_9PEZI|nr:benzoate 4-monooxygenase cytochrome p450 [Colletotrichum scovillei]KAG7043316.1 benzoate 4-monooxygenase cytochrome p450 [Colletotrichum scovillei]KAG7062764.1 benzoate 4-monooxygenase cytochrome p450 [Colletotrichum scovillei]